MAGGMSSQPAVTGEGVRARSLRMPSCTVITMASRRSMSSLVFREMPLAVFCRTGLGTCQKLFNHGLHLDQIILCLSDCGGHQICLLQ